MRIPGGSDTTDVNSNRELDEELGGDPNCPDLLKYRKGISLGGSGGDFGK